LVATAANISAARLSSCTRVSGAYRAGNDAAVVIAQPAGACSVVATDPQQPWSPAHGSITGSVL
jgi:hypothetical protein